MRAMIDFILPRVTGEGDREAVEGSQLSHDAPTVTMRIRIAPPPPFHG
jgi:hypothetical protein